MFRKAMAALVIASCALSLAACSGKQAQGGETTATETAAATSAGAEEKNAAGENGESISDGETADFVKPYTLSYDESVFEHQGGTTMDDPDAYYYIAEETAYPVYVAVQVFDDFDADGLIVSLEIQQGVPEENVNKTSFGADGIEATSLYLETPIDDNNTYTQVFHVIQSGSQTILVETGGYVGMSEDAEAEIEELLGTFKLVSE